MMIQDALYSASRTFRNAQIPSANLDSEVLLSHLLKKDRAHILAHGIDELTAEVISAFDELIQKRKEHVPIAHLIGHKEFFGIDLFVTPDTLIPRPETETLVELVLSYSKNLKRAYSILDIGTGSGSIAIALATHTPASVPITAVDSSQSALTIAQKNASRLHLSHRIDFLQSNLLSEVSKAYPVNPSACLLLIANLPYLSPADYEDAIALCPEVAYEPKGALIGGPTGLECIEALLSQTRTVLSTQDSIFLEIGGKQGDSVKKLAHTYFHHADVSIEKDLSGQDRFAIIENC